MRSRIGAAAALLVALAACARDDQTGRASSTPADERGAIYAVLLDSMRRHPPIRGLEHQYVQVETEPPSRWAREEKDPLPGVPPGLLAAFQAAEEQPADVRALVNRADVEWMTRDSLAEFVRPITFRANVAVTRFSPVGISADRRTALVYVSEWCGGLCGNKHWAVLERQPDGRWALKESLITAIS